MSIQSKFYFLFKIIIVASFFLPMVTTKATGSLKLVNSSNSFFSEGGIYFYSDQINEDGYAKMLDKICVNGLFINLQGYEYTKNPNLPQVENIYFGGLIKPETGSYKFKFPDNDKCDTLKNKEFVLKVKPLHYYEINLVKNNSNGYDLNLKLDKYDGDVAFTTIDNNIVYDGSTRREVGNCLDNVLVSTLSQSSKMAFLTTSDDEPQLPKVTVGEHLVSSYDGEKCVENATKVDIKPNTWYIFEVPLNGSQMSITQRSIPSKTIFEDEMIVETDTGRGASTVRTGGYSVYNYNFLLILIIALIQLFIPKNLTN
jgi:hypothetical protein